MFDWIFGKNAQPADSDDFWYGPIGRKVAAGVNVTEDTALNYSACWASTSLLSGSGSCLPLSLKRMSRDAQGRPIRETAFEHPVNRLIHDEPNSELTSMPFRALGMNRQINWGNFYAEIEFDGIGNPVALWPIHPSRVTPKRDKKTKELYYEVKTESLGDVVLMPYEMFHVRSRITYDGILGIGVVTAARESIGMGIATERHGAAYFGNGARPSGVLKHPGKLKPETRRQLRDEWNSVHGGPSKAGSIGVLQEGMEYVHTSFNNNDSQFLETREHNVEEIARWYGVPPTMIGDLRRSTFANIEHLSIDFVTHSLIPWLKLWEEEIWKKLLKPAEQSEYYAKHNVDALLRGDSETRAAFYRVMFELGAYSTNDIRDKEDMNPVEGGDVRYRPLNMGKLGTFDETNASQPTQMAEVIEPLQIESAKVLAEYESLSNKCQEHDEAIANNNAAIAENKQEVDTRLSKVESDVVTAKAEVQEIGNVAIESLQATESTRESLAAHTATEHPTTERLAATVAELVKSELAASRKAELQPMFDGLFLDKSKRMTRLESNELRRIAKKAKEVAWMESEVNDFYEGKFTTTATDMLSPVFVAVCSVSGSDPQERASTALELHIAESKRQLASAVVGVEADDLASRIETVTDGWEARVIQWEW